MDADTVALASAAYRFRLAVKYYLAKKGKASKYGTLVDTGRDLDNVLSRLKKAVHEGVTLSASATPTGSPADNATGTEKADCTTMPTDSTPVNETSTSRKRKPEA